MAIIKVRRTPKSAFDPGRAAPAVVQAMVVHLQKATKRKRRMPKTEGTAAKLLVAMTRELRAPEDQEETMKRMLLIAAIVMCAWPAAAQEGRLAAEFLGEKERLADDCGELKKIVSCATTLATDQPLHVAFGSIAPQNGFGLGVSFGTAHNPSENWRLRWSVDGVTAMGGGAWRAGASVKLIPTFVRQPAVVRPGSPPSSGGIHPYPLITIQAQSISLPMLAFYGLGPESKRDTRSIFSQQQTIAGVSAIVPIGRGPFNLSIAGEANGRDVRLVSPPPGNVPSIEELNSDTSAPGLEAQPRFVQFGEGVRVRPVFLNGHARLDYLVHWQQFIAASSDRHSFRRLTLDLRHDFPIYRESPPRQDDARDPNECAIDSSTNRCAGVSRNRHGSVALRGYYSRSYVSGLNTVPFYFQQTLGGSDINGNRMLAAYDDYRFRGPQLLLFQESVEHSLGRWPVGVWAAAEQGQVALQRASFDSRQFKYSVSGGLSLRLGGFPLAILSIANGSEGSHVAFTMSTSLLGGGSRPSLH